MTTDTPTRHFAFILAEEFSMFCVSAVIDVLRTANMVTGTDYYRWSTVSHDGEPVRASNGLTLKPIHSVDDLPPADLTFIVASLTLDFPGRQKIVNVLRTLGRRGVARMIEHCCDLTAELVKRLGELPGVEVLTTPIVNQGLVRFLAPDGDHDARTEAVVRRINASGEAWFGPTTWQGMRVMRISLSNFRVTSADLDRVVAAIQAALAT